MIMRLGAVERLAGCCFWYYCFQNSTPLVRTWRFGLSCQGLSVSSPRLLQQLLPRRRQGLEDRLKWTHVAVEVLGLVWKDELSICFGDCLVTSCVLNNSFFKKRSIVFKSMRVLKILILFLGFVLNRVRIFRIFA